MQTIRRRIASKKIPSEAVATLSVPGKTVKAAQRTAARLLGWMNRGARITNRPRSVRRKTKKPHSNNRPLRRRKQVSFGQRMARLRKRKAARRRR
jgi:hypothetical protein